MSKEETTTATEIAVAEVQQRVLSALHEALGQDDLTNAATLAGIYQGLKVAETT